MENELGKWKIAFVKLISSKWKNAKKIISYCYNLEICMRTNFPCSQGHWNSVNPSPYLNPGWILGAQTRRHLGFLEFSVRCCQEASDETYFSRVRSLSGSLAQPPGRLQTDQCLSTERAPEESNLRIPEQDGATQRLSQVVQ